MSTKNLFVKRPSPLGRRLLIWGVLVSLSAIIWTHLNSPKLDSEESIWTAPVEPVGAVVVTLNSASVKSQPSTTTQYPIQSQEPTTAAGNKTTLQDHQTPDSAKLQINDKADLIAALKQWEQAWSAKNIDAYLSFYGPEFEPPNGMSRETWESSRKKRISSKQKIDVAIQNLRLEMNGNTSTAKFTQVYSDERLRMTDSKTMVWQKHNGRWLIQRETTE